ncbi:MAG TPA: thioredoxin family protein [Thermoanaerobaculia bacterium]|nr:thioredoxin family protein [Thermoanaerobaculia bacterium]
MTRSFPLAVAAALLLVLSSPACGGPAEAPAAEEPADEQPLVGDVTRAAVEAHRPDWVAAEVEAAPDAAAVQALTAVPPGARVTVFLGTWCSDSMRELARLWRGLDDAGVFSEDELPFRLVYVAVDREKEEPSGRAQAAGLEYVPTFVVTRDGEEVGRMVEVSPGGIEHDLLALLSGQASGVISAREDLAGAGAADPTSNAAADPADSP